MLAVLCVVLLLLATRIVSRGEQWYQSLDSLGILVSLILAGLTVWQLARPKQQERSPFTVCSAAFAVKENLLFQDEISSLGVQLDYLPRINVEVDEILSRPPTCSKRNILIIGSDCSGKTREILEIANRHLLGGSVALVHTSDESLRRIRSLPIPRRKVYVLIDDLHERCRLTRSRSSFLSTEGGTSFVYELDDFVRKHLGKQRRKDVNIVASCTHYPSAMDDILWGEHGLWDYFEVLPLGFLSNSDVGVIARELAANTSQTLSDSQLSFIVENNTGVFVPLLELFNRVAESSQLDDSDLSWYVQRLREHWDRTLHRLAEEIPQSEALFQAIDILQQLEIDLVESLVVDVAFVFSESTKEELYDALASLQLIALPSSEEPNRIAVFRGQADLGYLPDDPSTFCDLAHRVARHQKVIGAEKVFDTALALVLNYGEVDAAIALWESVLEKPTLAPGAQFNVGVAIANDGDKLESAVWFAEALISCPELSVAYVQNADYVTRADLKSLLQTPVSAVSRYVAEAVDRLCDPLTDTIQVSNLNRDTLLQLSERGIEHAPDDPKVQFVRCRVLHVLGMHPEVIDELERLEDALLSPGVAPSAELLWEAARLRYLWADKTAEVRLSELEYAAKLEREDALRNLRSLETRLEIEIAKERQKEDIANKLDEGFDSDDLSMPEASQIEWHSREVQAAKDKIHDIEGKFNELSDIALEREEYALALTLAKKALEIDPTIGVGKDDFMMHLEDLSHGVSK